MRFAVMLALLTTVAACAQRQEMVDFDVRAADPTAIRTATLEPVGGSTVTGTATVRPGPRTDQTTVTIAVSGAPAGAVLPWHIHVGACGPGTPVYGPAAAYPAFAAGSDGRAQLQVILPVAAPPEGSFSVNVHASPQNMATIVACGNLRSSA